MLLSTLVPQEALLESLRQEVAALGGVLGDGWSVVVKLRGADTGGSKGSDPYYIQPGGKSHRSRKEARLSTTCRPAPPTSASFLCVIGFANMQNFGAPHNSSAAVLAQFPHNFGNRALVSMGRPVRCLPRHGGDFHF